MCLDGFGFGFYFVRLGATELNLGIVRHTTNIIFPMRVDMYKYELYSSRISWFIPKPKALI